MMRDGRPILITGGAGFIGSNLADRLAREGHEIIVYDALSRQLLSAYITKQYPNAMNVGASFGALKAARVGIDKGADALVEQLSSDATPVDGITRSR